MDITRSRNEDENPKLKDRDKEETLPEELKNKTQSDQSIHVHRSSHQDITDKDATKGISHERNENRKMETKEEQKQSQTNDRKSVQTKLGVMFDDRTMQDSLHKPGEDLRPEKSCNLVTDGALSQQLIKNSTTQRIVINLKNSEGMEESHRRDLDVVDSGATSDNRQGAGLGKSVDFLAPIGLDDLDSVEGGASEDQGTFDPYEGRQGATTNTPVTGLTDYIFHQVQGRGLTTPSHDHIYHHAISIMKKRCEDTRCTTTTPRKPIQWQKTPNNIRRVRPRKFTHRQKTANDTVRQETLENVVEEDGTTFPNLSLPAIVANTDKSPVGQMANCFIYVTQRGQHPIAPVKAWTGYTGNVYYEPVVCKKAGLPRDNTHIKAIHRAYSCQLSETNPAEKTKAAQLPALSQKEVTLGQNNPVNTQSRNIPIPSRHKSIPRTMSTAKSPVGTSRQLAVLDKQSVFNRLDCNLPEDIKWISGLEAMGTLHLGGLTLPRSTAHFYENTTKHHKLRIQRGLVSHQLASNDNSLPTLLGVHGGRLNDSADSIAKTKRLQSQYQICRVPQQSVDDIFEDYSGPFTSIEQLRRDSPSSLRQANSSCSSDRMVKDDSLHSMTSIYKHTGSNVPLYSNKEVLFRNREALFLSRPNFR